MYFDSWLYEDKVFCSNRFCILRRITYDLYKYVFSFALSHICRGGYKIFQGGAKLPDIIILVVIYNTVDLEIFAVV